MQTLRSSIAAAVAALALLPLAALPSAAQTVAVSFTQNAIGAEDYAGDNVYGNGEPGYNLGYEFSVSSPITVTSLGFFYDPNFYESNYPGNYPDASGYTQDHPVGIYDLSGDLLGSAVVSQDVANDTQIGDFEYTSLGAGLALTSGDYIIAGLTGPTDPYLFDVMDYTDPNNPGDGLITAPGIGYVQDEAEVSTATSTLANDNQFGTDGTPGSYFGPNFQFTSGVVPESSSLALILPSLLLLAAVVFGYRRARRQRSSD